MSRRHTNPYRGSCLQCGGPTQPRSGKGDAYRYGKACHPGARSRRAGPACGVLDAMRAWEA